MIYLSNADERCGASSLIGMLPLNELSTITVSEGGNNIPSQCAGGAYWDGTIEFTSLTPDAVRPR